MESHEPATKMTRQGTQEVNVELLSIELGVSQHRNDLRLTEDKAQNSELLKRHSMHRT